METITVRDKSEKIKIDDPSPRGLVVNMISGGPTTAGTSKNSRWVYAQEVLQVFGGPPKKARIEAIIRFDDN